MSTTIVNRVTMINECIASMKAAGARYAQQAQEAYEAFEHDTNLKLSTLQKYYSSTAADAALNIESNDVDNNIQSNTDDVKLATCVESPEEFIEMLAEVDSLIVEVNELASDSTNPLYKYYSSEALDDRYQKALRATGIKTVRNCRNRALTIKLFFEGYTKSEVKNSLKLSDSTISRYRRNSFSGAPRYLTNATTARTRKITPKTTSANDVTRVRLLDNIDYDTFGTDAKRINGMDLTKLKQRELGLLHNFNTMSSRQFERKLESYNLRYDFVRLFVSNKFTHGEITTELGVKSSGTVSELAKELFVSYCVQHGRTHTKKFTLEN